MEKRKYTIAFRIIHWAMALGILLILATIFLRLTWLNKNNVADIINQHLTQSDINLDKDSLTKIAKDIRKPMWNWHIYIGYFIAGLFIIRLLLFAIGTFKFKNPFSSELNFKQKIQAWAYSIFFVLLGITLCSGILMTNIESLKETMEEIHELSLFYVIPFSIIHFAGIFVSEHTDGKGVASKMIAGE